MEKEKILVTGGAGYIGSILVPALLNEGYSVKVLDNFHYAQNSLLDCCYNDNFSVVRGDCRNKNILKDAMKDADIIIPLAAMVGFPLCEYDQVAAQTINLDAIKLLLSLRSKEQKIIYPCTNSGYGVGEKGKYCTEESPLQPISIYGKTKVEAEKAVIESGNAVTFRFATIFGASPRMRLDLLVNDFVYRAVTDRTVVVFEGLFKRNYLHVRDAARAFIHTINNFDSMKNETYNVGLSDANLSKLELCAEIKKYLPNFIYMESEIGKDPDKRDYIVLNEKIEKTGFETKYSLDFGIQELIKVYTIIKNTKYSNI